MAEANEKLRQQMQEAPDGYFDIERVEEAQKVIEMVRFILDLANYRRGFLTVLFSTECNRHTTDGEVFSEP